MKTKLQAKVEARNKVIAEYNRLAPILQENFAPLVGKKIMKSDGLMEKYRNLVPKTESGIMYLHRSDYSLVFIIKVNVSHEPCGCIYDELSLYVGKIQNNNLAEILPVELIDKVYTVEQVLAMRKRVEKADKELRDAQAELVSFGIWD